MDEGIDIPECDAVYLTHPNNNPINIIQRISRSNRLDVNNKEKKAKVFLWCKNKIILGQIINNLSTYIKIIYGNEYNDVVNFKNKYDNNVEYIYNNNIMINSKFIDIFLKKLNIENKFAFKIKDKIVAEYINVTLDNVRRRLQNKYSKTYKFIENIDYIKIKFGKTTGVIYMINYYCFEKIAISGKNNNII